MKKAIAFILLASVLCMVGCAAHVHEIGKGAKGNSLDEARQWYILYGLIPLNEVDTADMADGAQDYTITTQYSPVDFVISIFTSFVTIHSRTVTVEK